MYRQAANFELPSDIDREQCFGKRRFSKRRLPWSLWQATIQASITSASVRTDTQKDRRFSKRPYKGITLWQEKRQYLPDSVSLLLSRGYKAGKIRFSSPGQGRQGI